MARCWSASTVSIIESGLERTCVVPSGANCVVVGLVVLVRETKFRLAPSKFECAVDANALAYLAQVIARHLHQQQHQR